MSSQHKGASREVRETTPEAKQTQSVPRGYRVEWREGGGGGKSSGGESGGQVSWGSRAGGGGGRGKRGREGGGGGEECAERLRLKRGRAQLVVIVVSTSESARGDLQMSEISVVCPSPSEQRCSKTSLSRLRTRRGMPFHPATLRGQLGGQALPQPRPHLQHCCQCVLP